MPSARDSTLTETRKRKFQEDWKRRKNGSIFLPLPPYFFQEGEGIIVSTATSANVEAAVSSKAELA